MNTIALRSWQKSCLKEASKQHGFGPLARDVIWMVDEIFRLREEIEKRDKGNVIYFCIGKTGDVESFRPAPQP